VSTPEPHDAAFETALRRALSTAGEETAECLDAETLAAWADGGLDAAALQRAEAHVADCARCQAMMATLVASEMGPGAAEVGSGAGAMTWWHSSIRWLMPLAGAATAVLVWMVLPDAARPPARERDVATRQPAAEPPAATPPAASTVARAPSGSTPAEVATIPSAPLADATLRKEARENAAAGRSAERVSEASDAMPKAGAPAAVAGVAPGVAGARRELAAAPPNPARATSDTRGAIVSGDPAVQWRLAGAGAVERSVDGGGTWARLDTGVSSGIVSGSAPTASVCWLAGDAGVVLLTTDARTFRRRAAPTSEDLVAIVATNERDATTRSVTGQSYRTIDGGTSWSLVP
jgi:hypothetical protein